MNKGDIVTTQIVDMTAEGAGLGRVEGMAVFVDGCIPGDKVQACLTKVKKNYAQADLVSVLEESEDRIEPACPYSEVCGGCTLQSMSYEAQLALKHKQVEDKIRRLGGIENPKVNDTVGQWYVEGDEVYEPFKYRNKGEYQVWNGPAGSLVGFVGRKSHRVVDIPDCLLQAESADAIASVVRGCGDGSVRRFTVKTAFGTGEVMVILEGPSLKLCDEQDSDKPNPQLENLIDMVEKMDEALSEIDYSLESVYLFDPKAGTNGRYRLFAGSRTILDEQEIGGKMLSFEISAPSFYQVNSEQMKKLYELAADYAGLTGEESVLDLYCGIGTIGLSMAHRAKMVVGIESVKEAVLDANRNSVINGVLNTRYIAGKAEDVLAEVGKDDFSPKENSAEEALLNALNDGKAVAILDPPRAGCDEVVLDAIANAGIGRIVYISCDPATLARDIKLLTEKGYEFIEATPVDMFPWTSHVETVALLTKQFRSLSKDI